MEDLGETGPIERSLLTGDLVVKGGKAKGLVEKGAKEIGLIGRGDIEIMRSLGTATTKQR
jgi:hypothetical protein